ncbi:outer membrane protein assembly factor BamE [Budvicia diplopodorum]|uniref:outer membrane protein assembly factor BamE n=1 Tax=Budvicia diplopodorum TaxID=1119056 RepID=UPI00135681E2|nr:outer membrane protein assembly factor BamE [Budvicia diplopodorum]
MELRPILIILLSLLLIGCVRNFDKIHEGTISKYSEQEIKKNIVIGVSTKRDVLMLLGRPNYPVDYNQGNDWIYTSQKMDRGFYLLAPVNMDEKLSLKLKFSDQKILEYLDYVQL